jgi:quinol monooxygenase YgiN/quercetin dioxygenase-like cupin family protein
MMTKIITFSVVTVALLSVGVLAQDPVPLYPDNYKVLLENDQVRVLDFQLKKGAKERLHSHPAAVTYVISPFKIRFTFADGSSKIREGKAGDVFYGDAISHSPENIGDTDAHGILVELKKPHAAESARAASAGDFLTAVTFVKGAEGKDEELKSELLALSAPTRAEPGNITYDLYQSPEKKNEFMRFEVWRSPQALEDHKQTPHLKASFERRQKEGWTTQITVWKRVAE